ncbi:MAG: response regulator [Granulosicoccus sp.]
MSQNTSLEHILVVEDDASLAQWIADYLTENHYQVSIANRGDIAIELVEDDIPDLVILDVNLPGANGFEVCKAIRKFYANPVLMLTARGDENDEVSGLEVGASDYLIKPVRPKALLARLQTLLRRDTASLSCLTFGALRVDADNRSVSMSDQVLQLSSNEFDLIWLLASNAGEVMSREDIVSKLRGIEYDGFDRSIDILVSRVRKKLNDDSSQPYLIKTVRGKGYLFTHDAW